MKRTTNRALRDADIDALVRELHQKLQPYWDGTPKMRRTLQQQYGRLFAELHMSRFVAMLTRPPESVETMIAAQKD